MNVIKDENLRLLYSDQEREFIHEKIVYHRRSFIMCVLTTIGMPIFYMVNLHFVGTGNFLLLVSCLIWAILGLFGFLQLPFAGWNLWKYCKMAAEHQEFLQKYNRLTN
ncbi:hypothetical protein RYZ26_00590 [Terasakiella sp. A23]|uniref:hypothetical protein n=1 Tax=Terasakiella sp. FCG-A23 TaxID=3080561 RepID=UPI00295412B5|nr:hypothetical protein [Terasakiella sp. A23]MDV7338071.1 hypothetical protein [Terasakiella sp. A23]